MHISMHFDSCNPKREPKLEFKAIWVPKECPDPACILSPLPRPLTPIGIVTLGMLDICIFRCISSLSNLNVYQYYNSKQSFGHVVYGICYFRVPLEKNCTSVVSPDILFLIKDTLGVWGGCGCGWLGIWWGGWGWW